jgi:predicted ferric reductase
VPPTAAHRPTRGRAAPPGQNPGHASRRAPRARPPARRTRTTPDRATLILTAAITAGTLPILALWWNGAPPGTLHAPGGYLTSAGRLTGLLAAYLLLALTALMARTPLIENRLGADHAARVHRALGEYTIALTAAHTLLIILGYAAALRTSPLPETASLLLDYPDVLAATAALGLLIWIGVVSARAVRRRLAYESWHLIHLYVYLAMALAFSHEFAVGADFSANAAHRILWSAAHILVAAALLYYRLLQPLTRSLRHHVRIERVVEETPDVISLHLTGRDLDRLGARPGQYLRWRFLTRDQWWQSHPYSLSAPPTAHHLRITVKNLGDHSRALRTLTPGTRVWFEGPYGAFTATRTTSHSRTPPRRTLLIAAGAGITPIRALYETLPGRGSDVILLYRATRAEDLALYPELTAVARHRGFGLYPLLGPRDAADPLQPAALRRLVPDIAERQVYLCGPPGLTTLATSHLRTAGVPAHRIRTETFDL